MVQLCQEVLYIITYVHFMLGYTYVYVYIYAGT